MSKLGSISLLIGLVGGGISDICEIGVPILSFVITTLLTLYFSFQIKSWLKEVKIKVKINEIK